MATHPTHAQVRDMIRDALHHNQTIEPAYMTRERTDYIIGQMYEGLCKQFGVTITEDHAGVWGGQVGQRLITLRFYGNDPKDLLSVSLVLKEVRSSRDQDRQEKLQLEDK